MLAHTQDAHLAIAGTCRDEQTGTELRRLAATSPRLHLLLDRVPPEQAGHLYAAAHAAVCPYRTDGPFSLFTDVLHPSSVATAAGFGVPVVAPELPAIEEMTRGQTRWLAPAAGLGPGVAAESDFRAEAQAGHDPRSRRRSGADVSACWQRIAAVYQQVAIDLDIAPTQPRTNTRNPIPPYTVGDSPGA